jgi:hypothetical protein
LKIHHALKETSYLTDTVNIAGSAAIATTIGNYLLANNLVASTHIERGLVNTAKRMNQLIAYGARSCVDSVAHFEILLRK